MSKKANISKSLLLVPIALFVAIAVFLGIGLTRDPQNLPSALLNDPAPEFELPALIGRDDQGLARSDLGGKPALVNVFASWCVPCRIEHPFINQLASEGTIIHGINYKDEPVDAVAWLRELGDPYARVGSDRNGRVGIDWGVYGVPETFVLDASGTIVYKHVGPLQQRDIEQTIKPLLEELAKASPNLG